MGAVHFSLDIKLVEALRTALPLDVLVETGTFQGDTVARALELFREILTVEWSAELFRDIQARFRQQPHVQCANESSPPWLRRQRPQLMNRSVLYWLDAHWCNAAETAGLDAQCPLLEELDAIESLNDASVVLIDDARLFLCTPPCLHNCEQWPRLGAVLEHLRRLSERHEIAVVNDVIVFAPAVVQPALAAYCRDHSVDWAVVMETSRQQSLAAERLTAERARVAEDHRRLIQDIQDSAEQLRFKNERIAELHALCLERARPMYILKALCRRIARLFGSRRRSPAPVQPERRAA
jgi:hypothetical protein